MYTVVSIFHFCSPIVWPMKLEQEHLVWPVEIHAQDWIYISGGMQQINKTYLDWNLSIEYFRCIFQLIVVWVGVLCHLMWLVCLAKIYLTYEPQRLCSCECNQGNTGRERGIRFCKEGCMYEGKSLRETWGSLVSDFTSSLGVCGIQVRNVKYSINILVLKWVSDLQLVLQEQWLQFVL